MNKPLSAIAAMAALLVVGLAFAGVIDADTLKEWLPAIWGEVTEGTGNG